MFDFKKNTRAEATEGPEKLKYSKYYEHDGALRAYANRAMVLAGSMTLLAFLSLGFAVYVRMQPPTIIRVSADGESSVISGRPCFAINCPQCWRMPGSRRSHRAMRKRRSSVSFSITISTTTCTT